MKAQELLAFDPRGSYFSLIFSWHQKHILLRQHALQQLFPHNLYVAHFSHLHSVVNCAKVHCRLVQLVYALAASSTPASQPRRFFSCPALAFMQMLFFSYPGARQLYRILFCNSPPNLSVISAARTGANFLSLPVVEMQKRASPWADFIASPEA
jgi:hypothetical protein